MDQPDLNTTLEALATTLAAWDPVDDREAASVAEVLEGLRTLDRPTDQDAHATHLTGSALVISSRGMVLLKHKHLGIWLQPGGHIDHGELPWQAALREAQEETGLAVRHPQPGPMLLHVDAHNGGRGHRHLDLRYVLLADAEDPTPPPEESQDCGWFEWDAAATIADPGLQGVIGKLHKVAAVILGA